LWDNLFFISINTQPKTTCTCYIYIFKNMINLIISSGILNSLLIDVSMWNMNLVIRCIFYFDQIVQLRRYVSYFFLTLSLLLNVVKSFDLIVCWKCKLFFRNLSMNIFDGPIVLASIFNLSSNLKVLDLSRNDFSGLLPNLSLFSTSLQLLWVHIARSLLVIWSWYFNRVCMKTSN